MGKAKEADDKVLLESLAKVMGGEPVRQTGTAKAPGIFPGTGATQKKLLAQALELGYLEECDGPPPPTPKRKSSKPPAPVPHARITPKGREWVLRQTSPRDALEALLAAFQVQSRALQSEESEVKVLQAQLGAIQNSFQEAQRSVQETAARRREDAARILATVQSVADTIQRLNQTNGPSGREGAPALPQSLESEAVDFVRAWERDRGADCPLPTLYGHLRGKAPALSIGAFHDLMRSLHERSGLRLTPWTGTLDDIREPALALFISTSVMYYAHTPDR